MREIQSASGPLMAALEFFNKRTKDGRQEFAHFTEVREQDPRDGRGFEILGITNGIITATVKSIDQDTNRD